jgi:ribonucleotide reductase beta subunit family protein with ferritin-like domain
MGVGQIPRFLRDESMHCNFGIDLINTIKLENPHLWTPAFCAEIRGLFQQGVELERYAEDTMPRGVLGLNTGMFKEYFHCESLLPANRHRTHLSGSRKPLPLDERNDRP